MLSDRRVYATIPAADLERAKQWYEQKLGVRPSREEPIGTIYELGGGTAFLLYPSPSAGQAPNTLATFSSTDIPADVAALRKRGIKFEDYDVPGLKTIDGIAQFGDRRAAWFKDSEGNILAIGDGS